MSGHNNNPKPDGAGKLLGGYATGNLADREKQQLFEAALQDQALFDAMVEEEGLRQLLEAPGVKRELLDSLATRESLWERWLNWFRTPVAWGAVGAVATAALALVFVLPRVNRQAPVDYARSGSAAAQRASEPGARTVPPTAAAVPESRVYVGDDRPKRVVDAESKRARRSPSADSATTSSTDKPQAATIPPPAPTRVTVVETVPTGPRQDSPEQLNKLSIRSAAPAAEKQPAEAPKPAAAPALEVAAVRDAAAPPPLGFDYQVSAEGVRVVASEDGMASLLTTDPATNAPVVVASARARKGNPELLRFPPDGAGKTFQVMLSRQQPGNIGTLGQGYSGGAVSPFRQKELDLSPPPAAARPQPAAGAIGGVRAKRAKAAAVPPPPQSGRATAVAGAAMVIVQVVAPAR